jgi:acyl-coenzyme A synthetase/AMP-(fatty) acid ligase
VVHFSELLARICEASDVRSNTIADGQFSCSYADMRSYLTAIPGHLTEIGVGAESCLAVECINSLAGALLLLALFEQGTSFVLTPPSGSNDLKPVPNFCAYRIAVAPTPASGEPFSPISHFSVEPNPLFNGKSIPPARLLLRTSGSMGVSKLVVHTHERMIGNARNCVSRYGFTAASRATIPVPIAHMYGFGAEFLPAILSGASIDLQEKTNLLKYLDREKRFGPTIAFATPAICEMLARGYKTPRTNYTAFVTSGQRISEELFRAFDALVGGRLINQYGSTEMGATSGCLPGESLDLRATTIGTAMPGVEIRIDPPFDESASGALLCQHPFGYEGYLNEDGEWIQRASADGWYRTGDLALVRSDGSIAVTGRADASINRRGYLVSLSDIERRMEKLPDLREVIVVAGSGENKQGQRIAAFCMPQPGIGVDGDSLRRQCFDLLPHYAIPDEVHVTESFPLLPSGKVDRRSLAAMVIEN